MTQLSRRAFLRLMGVSVAGTLFSTPLALHAQEDERLVFGRALAAEPVRARPHELALVVRYLWPDSVIRLILDRPGWLRVEDGYVSQHGVQPMSLANAHVEPPACGSPSWIQVMGPVAAIRSHCAADAPLIARVGHGGVLRAVDYLPGEPFGWLGVEDDTAGLRGWTQVGPWGQVEKSYPAQITGNRLVVDRTEKCLSLLQDNRVLLFTMIATGDELVPGTYEVTKCLPGVTYRNVTTEYPGVPWAIAFGETMMIAGAYWHNDFGHASAGPSAQLPPLVARWVYDQINEKTLIEVI